MGLGGGGPCPKGLCMGLGGGVVLYGTPPCVGGGGNAPKDPLTWGGEGGPCPIGSPNVGGGLCPKGAPGWDVGGSVPYGTPFFLGGGGRQCPKGPPNVRGGGLCSKGLLYGIWGGGVRAL